MYVWVGGVVRVAAVWVWRRRVWLWLWLSVVDSHSLLLLCPSPPPPPSSPQEIAVSAWRQGEPGVVFYDTFNRDNPLPLSGLLEGCNPCGEQFVGDGVGGFVCVGGARGGCG